MERKYGISRVSALLTSTLTSGVLHPMHLAGAGS
jgi:hypothetical protein